MLTLTTQQRNIKQKPYFLRKEGKIPAVFYGRKEKATSIMVSQADFLKVWREAGESTVVTLSQGGKEKSALIHNVQFDPVGGAPIHVDFYIIEADREVEVGIPLVFEGVSIAVKEKGGTLVKVLHEIEVKGLPKDLPHEITVDISSLIDLEDQITIKDIKAPHRITFLAEQEEVVAAISVAEEEEEERPEFDAEQVEVEKKGKEEDGGGDNSSESVDKGQEKQEKK